MIDVHPDELLDRARRGPLGPEDRARLDAHLASCSACAIEHRLVSDLAGEGDAEPGDDARIERALAAAMATQVAIDVTHAPASARARRTTFVRIAVAFAALLVLALAYASLRTEPAPAPPVAGTGGPAPEPAPKPIAEPEGPAPIATANEPGPSSASVVPPSPASPDSTKPTAAVPTAPTKTAAELFAQANQARRDGDAHEAVRVYRALQKSYPASAEANTSRVALGRLLLDKLGDPAGARAQFEAYLAKAQGGTLAEEARVGLALAVGRLGDASAERAAWKALLANHPDSVHAARARKRLEELGP